MNMVIKLGEYLVVKHERADVLVETPCLEVLARIGTDDFPALRQIEAKLQGGRVE